MRERKVALIYRCVGSALMLFSITYLIFVATDKKWFYILILWLAFVISIAIYRYLTYRKIYTNFNQVLEKVSGTINRGSYLFANPPSIKFSYANKACRVTYFVDHKFDHMIEYICPIDKEIELRIMHRKKKPLLKIGRRQPAREIVLNKEDFTHKFITQGQDSNFIDSILGNRQLAITIGELMQNFSYLYIGKDGEMRLIERYDSYLTQPERVFSIFDKIIKVANFIEGKT